MKKFLFFSFFITIFLISACDSKVEKDTNSQSGVSNETKEKDLESVTDIQGISKLALEENLSFQQFSELFENLSSNLNIPGYKLENSTLGDDLTMIDKEISFNKREYLTIDGNYSPTNIESSQETLFYLNDDSDRAIIVTLAFTESNIGNDIILYNITNEYGLPEEITEKNDLITLSYKNLIISILQSAKSSVELKDTQKSAKSIVNFLENLE